MQYVSLSKIPNQYPNVSKYTLFKEKTVLLNGVYPEKNKINFQLPEYSDIVPIKGTTFRFVLAIAADEKDTNPRLFTSKPFYDDIKIAYKVNNPYFPIQALTGNGSVVTIFLKEYFEIFQKMENLEIDTPVNVTKNIFLFDEKGDKGVAEISAKEAELQQLRIQLDDINKEIASIENEINDNITGDQRGGINIGRRRVRPLSEDVGDLNAQKNSIISNIERLDKEIKSAREGNARTSLLSEKTLIDYEDMVRFVDYMCSPATFSVQEIENGNVRAAELLGKWEGEWIDKSRRRAAGETIEATTIDERVVSNTNEEEEDKPKTVVGKVIAAIEKVPVIGTVVKGIKAAVKWIGKLFSDERLKTDLVKVGEIGGINIYKFKYKFDKSKIRIGVIAQELLKTEYADAISIDPETQYYVVNYDKIQEKIDIVGAIKKIEQNINSKTGGFSNLFKAKILSKEVKSELDNVRKEDLEKAKNNRRIFGTRNIESQSKDNFLFKLKNKKAAKDDAQNIKSDMDLGGTILKRKVPKSTKRTND